MSASRRNARRQARQAAKQLLRAGVRAGDIGRSLDDSRIKRVLLKMVDGLEKRIDTGEGPVSVREGLAAIKELRELEREQTREATAEEIAAEEAAHTAAEAAHELDEASRESNSCVAGASSPVAGPVRPCRTQGSAAGVPLIGAAG
ncbi:MAG: hypothetical protein IT462_06815 [Planctomycetes bacterium]|nr:hypothetical protein [Planctomycetota bacterium]